MSYRNDKQALKDRKEQLETQVAALRAKIRAATDATSLVDNTVKELEEVYAELNQYTGTGGKRRSLPLLQKMYVASPCNVPWDSMRGDDRVRHCGSCDKNVYDLSSLSTEDAEKLLAGGDVCAQFYRRDDGTILTADCPVGVAKKRKTRRKVAVLAATIASTLAAGAMAANAVSRREESDSFEVVDGRFGHSTSQTLNVQVTTKPPVVRPEVDSPPQQPHAAENTGQIPHGMVRGRMQMRNDR